MKEEMQEIEVTTTRAIRTERGEASRGFWARVWNLYYDGFRNMTVGRWLWAIILLKLAVLFLVFKLFFFPDLLEKNYDTDAERADAVRTDLIKRQ